MFTKTHIALGIGIALFFLPHINEKLIFFSVVLASSILPDLGTVISKDNKKLFSFPGSQSLYKASHSYTICVPIALILAFFYPVLALPFFLGYSFHLALESFTIDGIQPFWPYKKKSTGPIAPGGRVDQTVFYMLLIFDFGLLIKLFI
jgi:membrane-bound metal-dependent hydrolase YbcI (DUF457 family)